MRVLAKQKIKELQAEIDAMAAQTAAIQAEARGIRDELREHATTFALAGVGRSTASATSEAGATNMPRMLEKAARLSEVDIVRLDDGVRLRAFISEGQAVLSALHQLIHSDGAPPPAMVDTEEVARLQQEIAKMKQEYNDLLRKGSLSPSR